MLGLDRGKTDGSAERIAKYVQHVSNPATHVLMANIKAKTREKLSADILSISSAVLKLISD